MVQTVKKRNHHIKHPQDFYTQINEQWILHHQKLTSKKPFVNNFVLLEDKVQKQIKDLVLNKLIKNNKDISKLYNSFMIQNDPLIEHYIFSLIGELTEIQNNQCVYRLINWGFQKGLNQFLTFYISGDQKCQTENRFYIEEGGINIKDVTFYSSKNKKEIHKYYKLLDDMFSCIFGKNHSHDISKIIEIEEYLSKNLYDPKFPRTTEKIYNIYNNESCKKQIGIDWNILAKLLGFHKIPKEVIIENPNYTKKAFALLQKNWNTKEITTFYISNILFITSNYHSKLYKLLVDYCTVDKKLKHSTKQQRGISLICDVMNTIVNKEYLKYYENTKEIEITKYIVQQLMLTLMERLKKNHWLSTETIQMALKKCENMKVTIGKKKYWIPDPKINFLEDNIFENVLNYISWKNKYYIDNYYKPIPVSDTWLKGIDMNTYVVNAEYNANKNEIILPNAILQPPFVDATKTLSYNMATIGTLIGHEISHGFDNTGSLYDHNGSYHIWWKKEDYQMFQNIQKQVKDFYLQTANKDHNKVNQELTLGENIADISGMMIAEEMFMNELIKNKIYGTDQIKYLKQFYENYTKLWSAVIHPKFMKNLYKTDVHSFAKYRVNNSLLLSSQFQKTFHTNIEHPNIMIW